MNDEGQRQSFLGFGNSQDGKILKIPLIPFISDLLYPTSLNPETSVLKSMLSVF